MLRILLIGVERRTVAKRHDEAGIVGPRRADDVFSNFQVDHARQTRELPQLLSMVFTRRRVRLRFVLEGHNVNQHQSSSASIDSSGTSTTTLWMSTRNHSRKVLRSRVVGQTDSSSV